MFNALAFETRLAAQESAPIKYPPEFVSMIQREYAEDPKILEALESGDYVLGKYLMERMDLDICPEQIVMALEGGRVGDVLEEARAAVRRTSMYLDWTRIAVHHVRSLETRRSRRIVP